MAKEKKTENIKEGIETSKEKEAPIDKKLKKKQNKQIFLAILMMATVIGIAIAVPILYNKFYNEFTFINLDFQKTKLGNTMFYSTKIPITNVKPTTGSVIKQRDITALYGINFRNDPRYLDVKTNVTSEELKFVKIGTTYFSFNPDMQNCPDNGVAMINLASFLKDFARINIKSAVSKEEASTTTYPYVTCKNRPQNTVIMITSGNETKIEKDSENCYILTYNNCEVTQVTEKFEILLLEGYMRYFE
ncbi:MAG: hypothetical protein Q8N99_04475 [Nanoarchaeota archaeon]|nr:hypothetical protein [Nanoarchaeota archaeon]